MTVSVTNQSTPLGNKIVQDTSVVNVAVDNATGASGTLYAVEITTTTGSTVFFKLADTTDATAGTTAADIVLRCPGNSQKSYIFPGGIPFTAGFSHWCVLSAAESNTTTPGDSNVSVSYVTS